MLSHVTQYLTWFSAAAAADLQQARVWAFGPFRRPVAGIVDRGRARRLHVRRHISRALVGEKDKHRHPNDHT